MPGTPTLVTITPKYISQFYDSDLYMAFSDNVLINTKYKKNIYILEFFISFNYKFRIKDFV